MKTIRKPKSFGDYKIECCYSDCAAVMICKKEELECSGDWREGYTYTMTCPHCAGRTFLTSDNLRKCQQ